MGKNQSQAYELIHTQKATAPYLSHASALYTGYHSVSGGFSDLSFSPNWTWKW